MTMRNAPPGEHGMRGDDHNFPKNGSRIFFTDGLDAIPIKRTDLPVVPILQQAQRIIPSSLRGAQAATQSIIPPRMQFWIASLRSQ
jgi:hypothetical protein